MGIGRFLIAVLGLLLVVACSSTSGPVDPVVTDGTSASAKPSQSLQRVSTLPAPLFEGSDPPLVEDDLLEIDVFEVDELDRTVRIDSSGNISLALVDMVKAAGRTAPELETHLEQLYGARYLQNPEISVFVKESAGRRVTVHGAVAKPGVYPVTSGSTLLQVVAQAGGFRDIADQTKLYVFRSLGERMVVAEFDVTDIRNGQSANPQIYGGDIVVSFSSGAKAAMRNLRETLGIATRVGRLATY